MEDNSIIPVERVFRMVLPSEYETLATPARIRFTRVDPETLESKAIPETVDILALPEVTIAEATDQQGQRVKYRQYVGGKERAVGWWAPQESNRVRWAFEQPEARVLTVMRHPAYRTDANQTKRWFIEIYPDVRLPDGEKLILGRIDWPSGEPLHCWPWVLEDVTDNPMFSPLGLLRFVPVPISG